MPYSPMKDNDLVWNSVQGTISFADDVSVDKITEMFSVKGPNNMAKIKIAPTEQNGVYTFSVDSLKREETSIVDYVLHVDGKPLDVDKQEKSIITLPKIKNDHFTVIDARVAYDPQECIRITFSDPLSNNQNIQGLVSPNGIDNFSYDIQKNVMKLYLDTERNSKNIDLVIQKELKNANNKQLDKRYKFELYLEKK